MQNKHRYFIFNKPFRTLSSFTSEDGKKNLADYLKGLPKDVYPIGRLDYDSEGLLLLTNDKALNHQLLNPAFGHSREYWVQVEGQPDNTFFEKIAEGLLIRVNGKPFQTKPAEAKLIKKLPEDLPERNPPVRFRKNIPTTWISLTLREGKNRQVRKMTAAAGFPTLRLIRHRIEKITLENIRPGDYFECPQMRSLLGLNNNKHS